MRKLCRGRCGLLMLGAVTAAGATAPLAGEAAAPALGDGDAVRVSHRLLGVGQVQLVVNRTGAVQVRNVTGVAVCKLLDGKRDLAQIIRLLDQVFTPARLRNLPE